jgi:KDO2-lipid IV(A) lauroyltransferase
MKLLFHCLFLIIIYPISLLPFWVLYFISDGLRFVLYRILRYRKSVVVGNLKKAFPQKSNREINQIARGFYKNLCDNILESIKLVTISKEKINRRCVFEGTEMVQKYFEQGKSVVSIVGHFTNWEIGTISDGRVSDHEMYTIYKKLRNPYLDQFMKKTRRRFGFKLLEMKEVGDFYKSHKGKPTFIVYIADQAPSNPRRSYWTTFLNQDTPVFYGPELLARRYDLPVIFGKIDRVKRGQFKISLIDLVSNPRETERGEITEIHTRFLERLIKDEPEKWLWSHKRWKRKREEWQ